MDNIKIETTESNFLHSYENSKEVKNKILQNEVSKLKSYPADEIKSDANIIKNLEAELLKEKNNTMIFGYLNVIYNSTCKRCIKKKNHKIMKVYNDINSYVNEKLDITFYLKNLEKLERLKLLLLNPEQNIGFDFIKNPNLADESEMQCFELRFTKNKVNDALTLINNYIKKVKEDKLEEIDIEMLPLIDPVLKKYMINNK
jgi:hypothetical protein